MYARKYPQFNTGKIFNGSIMRQGITYWLAFCVGVTLTCLVICHTSIKHWPAYVTQAVSIVAYPLAEMVIPGEARLGRRPTGVGHSKITRVCVLSWPLSVLPSLYFLTVTKSCHTKFPMKCDESLVFVVAEVVSNQFKAIKTIKKIFLRMVVITKNYMSNRCFP